MVGAVDTELARLTSILQTLAANEALDRRDLLAFRAAALRVKEADGAWANVILADVSTTQLVNLIRPPAAPLPTSALWPEPFKRALAERRPVIGSLVPFGPILREPSSRSTSRLSAATTCCTWSPGSSDPRRS